jgi:uncharacterized protein YndB with AHSA1/START domain
MSTFFISMEIDARREDVWRIMSDVEKWSQWTPSIKHIRLLDGRPLTVGGRAFVRQPRVMPAVWKVTALEPNRSFTWTTGIPGLLFVVAVHSVEDVAKGSRATLSLTFSGLFGGIVARLTKNLNERYLSLEAVGLKRVSESSRAGPSSIARGGPAV